MRTCVNILFALTFVFAASAAIAEDTLSHVLRPRIGLGTGTFTYYGELQNYQKNFVPTVNRYGGMAYVNAPVTRYFNLEFSASYGRFTANERSLSRNFNFMSRVRMGSVYLYYNFYPFFSAQRSMFHPFVGVGISSFEFLSKTDLVQDTSGLTYYYWSDGSIMDMDENDPLAPGLAKPLARDYTYETDLREQNYDGLGKYREQSFAIPITAGFEFHLSPRWDFRFAGTLNLTFTDLIDNISPAGTGIRQGDYKKDRLLFTYVSLSYDLQFGQGEPELIEEDDQIPLYADWDQNDWDHDGVIDALDDCPGTPLEAIVNTDGCPQDHDEDGVPDYNDDEPETPLGNYVDEYGVTITKEQFDRHWELYNDSTGYLHEFAEQRTTVQFRTDDKNYTYNPYKVPTGKNYVIIVGKEHKDVTANDLHKYLGYNDFKTITRGDTVYYVLGEYTNIDDAVAAKTELENKGVEVDLIGKDNVRNGTLTPVDTAVINKVEMVNIQTGKNGPDYGIPVQLYRVQVGAFKNKIDEQALFPGLEVVHGTAADGITRYYSGSFTTYDEAETYRKTMVTKGYKNAFVVAYEGQERKTLVEAGVDSTKLPPGYDEQKELNTFVEKRDTANQNTELSSKVDWSKVKYRVKMGSFTGDVPINIVNVYYDIGGVKGIKNTDGSATTYYSREFKTQPEAENAILDYKTYGLNDMTVVVEYRYQYYTLEEFQKLLEE
ncbi:MAG: SPOR domain-containing protein [Bacteroidetes bacterium]|nr:SPOR domain-containing protein [Bacteroidota bacterium]